MSEWGRWNRRHVAALAELVLPDEAWALGVFPGRADPVPLARLRAVYDALLAVGVAYDHEPMGGDDRRERQAVRPPGEVLDGRRPVGTCLDICLVGAGLCLRAGLHPLVLVTGSHALLAVWLGPDDGAGADWHDGPGPSYPFDDPAAASDLRAAGVRPDARSLGAVVALDLTLVATGYRPAVDDRSFDDAVVAGAALLQDADDIEVCDVGWEWHRDDQRRPDLPWDVATELFSSPFDDAEATMVRSPTRLTRAQFRVVAYQQTDLHTVLMARCEAATPDHPHVWVVPGAGGSGKTRLAAEVVDELTGAGWTGGIIGSPSDVDLARLRATRGRIFVAVDYADAAEAADLVELIQAVAGERRGPAVVLLLARTTGVWWKLLDDALVTSRVGVHTHQFEDVARPGPQQRRAMWRAACRGLAPAFAEALGREIEGVDDLEVPEGDRWTSLDLVLLAWLAINPDAGDELPGTRDDLYGEVLDHEERYWRLRLPGAGDDWRRWAARLTVAAPTERDLALSLLPSEAGPATVDAFARVWAGGWSSGRSREGLALRPDAVGDHLVRSVFETRPDELADLLALLGDRDASPDGAVPLDVALTNLARSETDHPEAQATVERLLDTFLTRHPQHWAPVVVRALYGSMAAAAALDAVLATVDSDTVHGKEMVRGLAFGAPVAHPVMRGLALRATERWNEVDPDTSDSARADRLSNLAVRLGEVGRRDEALHAAEEAVALRRQLVAEDPDAFTANLALGLNNLANHLAAMGRRVEAVAAAAESVAAFRTLAEEDPDAFMGDLAMSLGNQAVVLAGAGHLAETLAPAEEALAIRRLLVGDDPETTADLAVTLSNLAIRLAELGRVSDALAPAEEAVAIRRWLAGINAAAYTWDLASSLNNLANHLAEAGRRTEALAPAEEAVAVYRGLVGVNADAFTPDLASSLNNVAIRLTELGRVSDALAPATEAMGIRRQLAEENPAAFRPSFAVSLNNLANHLGAAGRRAEALEMGEEAVAIRRQLADEDPAAFSRDLAMSLTNLSKHLADIGRVSDALGPAEEAVVIRRRLVEQNPEAHASELARSLNTLSVQLAAAGRRAEALATAEEAVGHLRRLAAVNAEAYASDLAMSLGNLANRLTAVGQLSAALGPAEEAVTIYRRLSASNEEAFFPELSSSLSNFANHLANAGRNADALEPAHESVRIRRQLVQVNPAAFTPDLGVSVSTLSNRLAGAGMRTAALAAAEEAVTIHRALVATDSDAYTINLARSLNNLAIRLSNVGRHDEALAAAEEALAIRRQLVAMRPTEHLPDLAKSLGNLATRLAQAHRLTEALDAAQEAVEIRRQLAAEDPGAFIADLAASLGNLSVRLAAVERQEEALRAAEETVAIRRRLAAANPEAFGADFAVSLINLATQLSKQGQRRAAVGFAQEAVAIRRGLAEVNPEGATLELARTLNALREIDEGGPASQGAWADALASSVDEPHRALLLAVRALQADDPAARRADIALAILLADGASGPLAALARHAIRSAVEGSDPEPGWPAWATTPIEESTTRARVDAWLSTTTWSERRTWLEEVLGDPAFVAVIGVLAQLNPDIRALAALAAIVTADDPARAAESYLSTGEAEQAARDVVRAWLLMPTWREASEHLAAHQDELRSPGARSVLEAMTEDEGSSGVAARQHLAILELTSGAESDWADVFALVESPPLAMARGLRAVDDGDLDRLRLLTAASPGVFGLRPHGVLLAVLVLVSARQDIDDVDGLVASVGQAYRDETETVRESARAHLGWLGRRPWLTEEVVAFVDALLDALA